MIDINLDCIEFSKEITDRASNLGKVDRRLLSDEILKIANAIAQSGFNVDLAQDISRFEDSQHRVVDCLNREQINQEALVKTGITDDTTANAWLTPIEEKLTIARSEYQKLSDRQAAEREEFCKQWMVAL